MIALSVKVFQELGHCIAEPWRVSDNAGSDLKLREKLHCT